jgi:hypothetical protein
MWKLHWRLPLALAAVALQTSASVAQAPPRRIGPQPGPPRVEVMPCPPSVGVALSPAAPPGGWMPNVGMMHATLDDAGARVDTTPGGKFLVCSYRALNQSGAFTLMQPMGPRYCRARADKTGFECGDRPNF